MKKNVVLFFTLLSLTIFAATTFASSDFTKPIEEIGVLQSRNYDGFYIYGSEPDEISHVQKGQIHKLVGKTMELNYETGYHFKVEYLTENKLRWTSLTETTTDGTPLTGEETYYLNQQTDDIFIISWVENTGFSVTQVLDFNQMTVYAFMSWKDSSAKSGRTILDHRGTIKFI